MVMASTCGDSSLEAAKRHMRRILGSRGMGMQQDALLLKDDSNNINPTPYMASSSDDASDYPRVGETQVASKKKREKKKKGKKALTAAPPANRPKNGATPERLNPRTDHRNRCYSCNSDCRMLTRRPERHCRLRAATPPGSNRTKSRRPP